MNDLSGEWCIHGGGHRPSGARSAAEAGAIARYQPFSSLGTDTDVHTLYIAFLGASPDAAAQQRLVSLRNETDEFHIHQREVCWLRPTRVSGSHSPVLP